MSHTELPDARVDPRVVRTREKAMAATIDLLIEDGPRAVTHQRVAQRAGIGRATVYRHWPRGQDLIYDSLLTLPQRWTQPRGANLRERLVSFLEDFCERATDRTSVTIVSLIARSEWDEEARAFMNRLADAEIAVLASVFAAAEEEEGLRLGIPLSEVHALLAGPYVYERLLFGEVRSRAQIPAQVDALVSGWEQRFGPASRDRGRGNSRG